MIQSNSSTALSTISWFCIRYILFCFCLFVFVSFSVLLIVLSNVIVIVLNILSVRDPLENEMVQFKGLFLIKNINMLNHISPKTQSKIQHLLKGTGQSNFYIFLQLLSSFYSKWHVDGTYLVIYTPGGIKNTEQSLNITFPFTTCIMYFTSSELSLHSVH